MSARAAGAPAASAAAATRQVASARTITIAAVSRKTPRHVCGPSLPHRLAVLRGDAVEAPGAPQRLLRRPLGTLLVGDDERDRAADRQQHGEHDQAAVRGARRVLDEADEIRPDEPA